MFSHFLLKLSLKKSLSCTKMQSIWKVDKHAPWDSFIWNPLIWKLDTFWVPQGPSLNHFGNYILTYLRTYVFTYLCTYLLTTYVQVIFEGRHPTLKFSITFILCKYTIFLLLRVLNYKKNYFWTILGQIWIQLFKDLQVLLWIT